MPHRVIDRIRQTILLRDYDVTVHAMEEMAEDDLDIFDIEEAILNGRVVRRNKRIRLGQSTQLKAWLWMAKHLSV